jgi:hypothetical protein
MGRQAGWDVLTKIGKVPARWFALAPSIRPDNLEMKLHDAKTHFQPTPGRPPPPPPTHPDFWPYTSQAIAFYLPIMVLLSVSPAVAAALREQDGSNESPDANKPISHKELIKLSRARRNADSKTSDANVHLNDLLRGCSLYRAPPPPKPEPVCQHILPLPGPTTTDPANMLSR